VAADWLVWAVIIAVATSVFGHFETVRPMWLRIARWLAVVAVTGALVGTAGRPWTVVWSIGLPMLGAVFHLSWCLRLEINPVTAEARDRYAQLRAGRRIPHPDPRH
jgi:hypothetical protein